MAEKPINYWVIAHAFTDVPCTLEVNGLFTFDPNDESSAKRLFARYIIPRVSKWSNERKLQLKQSLAYYLNDTKALSDVLEFDLDNERPDPNDPRIYFRWMFETLFPFDDPDVYRSNVSQDVDNDILKANFVAADFAGSAQQRFEADTVVVDRLETAYCSTATFCNQRIRAGNREFVLTKSGSAWLDEFARGVADGPIGDEFLGYVIRPVLFSLVQALQQFDSDEAEFGIEKRVLEWDLAFMENHENRDVVGVTLAKRVN